MGGRGAWSYSSRKRTKRRLTKREYAIFQSEVNKVYHAKFHNGQMANIIIGNYRYRFIVNGFNEYDVIEKWRIK